MNQPPDHADHPELPAGYRLRALGDADVEAVLDLERALFPHDAWPESFFREELAQAGPAEQGGTRDYRVLERRVPAETDTIAPRWSIIGYAGLMCVPPLADVQTIGVHPESEGVGLGSAVLGWLGEEARRRGAEDLLLEVRADNHRAQRLYVRHGFEHIHTRSGYYPQGVDAMIMRRHLHTGSCRWD